MRITRHLCRAGVLVFCTLGLVGCETLGYYAQALRGQAQLWQATRPIDAVVADPEVPRELKERLCNVRRVREFASRELGLPDNRSYRDYADLKRAYVVWNVFAAGPYSVTARRWCFPVAGCVAYKGYFAQERAESFASELRRAGDDVHVAGVPAYSTLGFLDDPVLNTFVNYPPVEVARLMFHELAHQVVYVSGDTTFNESFAVTVEHEGVRRWLERHGGAQALLAFERAQQRRAEFQALVLDFRDRLARLYASGLAPEEMRDGKDRIFAELNAAYAVLKRSWDGYDGYDSLLGRNANNASLASVAVYTQLVPAFQAMLDGVQGVLPEFYAEARRVAEMPRSARERHLVRLVRGRTQASVH